MGLDPMSEASPYARADLYDLEYADVLEDIPYYVHLASSRACVLELGCGTGRLTLPIARNGTPVFGVDQSQDMLTRLETKTRLEADEVRLRVRYAQGDFRSLSLEQRFPLVIWPFNALHHCADPSQILQVLDSVRSILVPGGLLALDCYLPDPQLYGRNPERKYEHRNFQDPATSEWINSWEQGWWDAENSIHNVVYVYQYPDGREYRSQLSLRMYTLAALHKVVQQSGFTIVREAQDFKGSPIRRNALKWVVTLKP
jgi:SAM-dependent methyltransferase